MPEPSLIATSSYKYSSIGKWPRLFIYISSKTIWPAKPKIVTVPSLRKMFADARSVSRHTWVEPRGLFTICPNSLGPPSTELWNREWISGKDPFGSQKTEMNECPASLCTSYVALAVHRISLHLGFPICQMEEHLDCLPHKT